MKIELRRITRPVRLRDYAEEYGDEVIHTWVNPSRAKRLEIQALGESAQQARDQLANLGNQEDELTDEDRERIMEELKGLDEELSGLMGSVFAWYADLWSQNSDEESHWTADEVRELVSACQEADPALWDWLQDESLRFIKEHREGIKKK